ncbi:NUDIX domain-containing protein [Halorarius halobius]|uniref:NUDIX domain-containing protein n=1 Tax=Halorarius halobius TaxID=2962671 RepID=UPI0020CDBACB|nr:NUDIX domain-containing protein [Halorarius halobius]
MTLDRLWYLADEARQQAEQARHRLASRHDPDLEPAYTKRVSRRRFRTLAERITRTGAPYGAHTLVYKPSGELLLVRHEGVDMWVLPGGGIDDGETFREAAERELAEEAGVDVEYDGLGMLGRVDVRAADHETWGVLPVFAAAARTTDPEVSDPDGEISEARWFADLPEDTRDRADIRAWRDRVLTR